MLSLSQTSSYIIKNARKIVDNHFQHANATIELRVLSIEILSNPPILCHVLFGLLHSYILSATAQFSRKKLPSKSKAIRIF